MSPHLVFEVMSDVENIGQTVSEIRQRIDRIAPLCRPVSVIDVIAIVAAEREPPWFERDEDFRYRLTAAGRAELERLRRATY